jgi:hypothetical protein
MDLLTALMLILCGGLAASTFIVQKQPNARQYIDKLTPYQGWIGIITLLDGVLNLFHVLFAHYPGPFLLTAALEVILGFLMGYGLIVQHMLRDSAEATTKAEHIRGKLSASQIPLGLLALVLGLWALLGILTER